jgi:hypothetical protein
MVSIKNRFWLWPDKLATVWTVIITVALTALYCGTPGVESLTGSYFILLGVLIAVPWVICRSLSRAIWESRPGAGYAHRRP